MTIPPTPRLPPYIAPIQHLISGSTHMVEDFSENTDEFDKFDELETILETVGRTL